MRQICGLKEEEMVKFRFEKMRQKLTLCRQETNTDSVYEM